VTSVPGRIAAGLVHRWRRSLQLRVAATTLVLSATVIVAVGFALLHQVRDGLLNAKTRTAVTQLDSGLQHAAAQFVATRLQPSNIRETADSVVQQLGGGGEQASYGVVLLSRDRAGESPYSTFAPADVPRNLRHVVSTKGREAWTFASIGQESGSPTPGLVVGGPVPLGSPRYQLYYLFPLTQEQQTLSLVEREMLLAGAGIVVLLVGIAMLVTRLVVPPVRLAAAIAERLAAGRLRDRMTVHGEDDLASLATSFNRMAQTLEQQISQLRELSRLQRRFVADVSHELRTPITTIRMAADVLHDSRGDLPPELRRSAELLQTQVDRFELLLADLLEISRIDAGAVALDTETVDLRSLVRRVTEDAAPLAGQKSCSIDLDLPADPVVLEADPRRIERILRNLVSNAIEHGEGCPVGVRVRGGAGGVAVTVRDGGGGLRPGDASRVFGRFWRADPARARTSGGTGLGLSIALEDARLHGGWLQAWGEPGKGSVFRLTLPWRVGGVIDESPLPLEPQPFDTQPAETQSAGTQSAEPDPAGADGVDLTSGVTGA
jgi:two-component system sensor histidine kinase MtrB